MMLAQINIKCAYVMVKEINFKEMVLPASKLESLYLAMI